MLYHGERINLRKCVKRRETADRKKREGKRARQDHPRRSNRCMYCYERRASPSDVTDEAWALLEPLIPPGKPGGRPVEIRLMQLFGEAFSGEEA
jgi:hypothetical protein